MEEGKGVEKINRKNVLNKALLWRQNIMLKSVIIILVIFWYFSRSLHFNWDEFLFSDLQLLYILRFCHQLITLGLLMIIIVGKHTLGKEIQIDYIPSSISIKLDRMHSRNCHWQDVYTFNFLFLQFWVNNAGRFFQSYLLFLLNRRNVHVNVQFLFCN